MEFEKLTRRELQTLCKKNKIPANITNVAMTQALKSRSFVEGIEEIMQPSQSETVQSSIDSPERKEVTSPCIPPTGGRRTRRRTAVKEQPETLPPVTRTTRRSTRKALATDDTQTPLVVQTTTRRARLNSVCRKMDSQLKECDNNEEKRDTLVTPAPSGVSTRRRGMKEESVVKREYTTRRSARLAAKKVDVQDLEVDVFTNEGENENMSIKASVENVEESLGIMGNCSNATVGKIFEQTKELEDVSAQMHCMQIGEGDDNAATVDTLEGIGESEDVQGDEHAHTGKEIDYEASFEEMVHNSELDDLKLEGWIIVGNTALDENLEKNSEEEEELEVFSAQEHGIQIYGEGDSALSVHNLEEHGELEDVQPKEKFHKEIKQETTFKEDTVQKSEVDYQKLGRRSMSVNTSMDIKIEENSKDVLEVSTQKHYVLICEGITGNDANATVEKNSEQKEELKIVSTKIHSIQIGEEGDNAVTLEILDGQDEVEDVQHEEKANTDNEIDQETAFEEETEQKSDVDNQKFNVERNDIKPAMEYSEEELEVVSTKKQSIQIGEEGDDSTVTLDNLEGKGESEEHVTAEEHVHVGEENKQVTSEVDEYELDAESIHGNAGGGGKLEEIFEKEMVLDLELMSAQKHYMQIGEEGEEHAATVDTLEGKCEENIQAEGHGHIEIERVATFDINMGQKSEVDDQKLDGEIIDVNTYVDRNSEVNFELEFDSVKDLKTTIEEEGTFETDSLKGEIKEFKNIENKKTCSDFKTEVEGDYYEDKVEYMVHDNDVVEIDSVKGLKSIVVEEGDGNSEAYCLNSEEVKNMKNEKAGIHFEPIVEAGDFVENELNLDKSSKSMIMEAKVTKSNEDLPLEISFAGSDSDLIVKPTCLTPYKVSETKTSPMVKKVTIMSDNEKNVDSGSKVNLPKERVKVAAITKNTDENYEKIDDLSMRKLAKMLAMKLQITNKFSKNEIEVRSGRPALKALSGNQLVDETHNN